jgi:hypothetical protein
MTLRMSAYRDRPEVGKPVVKTTRLTHFRHRTKSYCLASSTPFEKSVDKRRRKGATARLASRQSSKKPKDAVRHGKHDQVAAIERDYIARVAMRAIETRSDGQQDNRQEKEEVQIEYRARCVGLVGQPALVRNPEHACNNKADQRRDDLRLVCGPNCGPDWHAIWNLSLGKIIGEQCHRDAKNRVA